MNNQNNMENKINEVYPVNLEIKYPENSSRLLALLGIPCFFLKALLLLPHLIIMWFLNIACAIAAWFALWVVLFTGKYPKTFFDFISGVLRWQIRLNAWVFGLTDKYPPFTL